MEARIDALEGLAARGRERDRKVKAQAASKRVRVCFGIDEDLKRAFRLAAVGRDETMSDVLLRAVRAYIEEVA